ncbi:hypothetical protein BGX29_004595 [Mortierella sp. GBA35]|nr:hypothetical protein BGX29_004595 [Mortierella sp. GBA35]
MISIPEILHLIATFVDAESCLACISVCRQWNKVFTPHLWRTVDPRASPHKRIFETGGEQSGRKLWISALLQTHRHHIRELMVTDDAVLFASLNADLTGLQTLSLTWNHQEPNLLENVPLDSDGSQDGGGAQNDPGNEDSGSIHDHGGYEISGGYEGDVSESDADLWQSLIPTSAFVEPYYPWTLARTRACWRLILTNPGLRHLVLEELLPILELEANWSEDPDNEIPPVLTPTSRNFLVDAFSRLTSIQHIEIGMIADDFLLGNLATLLPNLTSFIHSDVAYFDPSTILSTPHRALKKLEFKGGISTSQFRAIVVAFPALSHLTLLEFDRDSDSGACAAARKEVLVHASLEHLSIRYDNCLRLDARTRFPKITQLNGDVEISCANDIRKILWTYPALQRLYSRNETAEGVRLTEEEKELYSREVHEHKIQALTLDNLVFDAQHLDTIVAQMPFLVELKIDGDKIDGRALRQITKTCRRLERLYFDLQEGCTREMLGMLAEGPTTLKSCRGEMHVVLAEDAAEGPEWSCIGLEELDIEVFGVPRLSEDQERLLGNLQRFDSTLFMSTNEALVIADPEEQDNMEEILERLQHLGHELTAGEVEALERRRYSHAVQRKVYRRLGRLTQLQRLNFGKENGFWIRECPERVDTLEFNLTSGLAELATLKRLEDVHIFQVNHRIGEADLDWMMGRWSMERKEKKYT